MERLAAVVLAAGRSSRMSAFKPLAEAEGRTLLEWAIGGFFGAGVEHVVVVTGHRGAEVAPVAARAGAVAVANHDFDDGMFSSVRAGVEALDPGVARFFLLPADVPLVRPETIGKLARDGGSRSGGDEPPTEVWSTRRSPAPPATRRSSPPRCVRRSLRPARRGRAAVCERC